MAVLAIREFERIHCGDTFDPIARVVTPLQHALLERFSEEHRRRLKVTVFQHGPRRSLVAQNFVGIINLGSDQVEVLPKIETGTNEVRRSLARMIATALDLDLHGDAETQTSKHGDSVLEILVRLFCRQLWQAVRRGVVRRYESKSDNLTVLRGRLSVTAQIRQNLARPDRLSCDFDEFTEDNLLNQVLKAALRVLHPVVRNQENLRNIAELLFCFQDVDDVPPAMIKWNLVSTDRLTVRYKPLLTMARLFIEGRSPDVVTGQGQGFALLFDMNELFESYVGQMVRKVLSQRGLRVHLQGPKRHLAQHSSGVPAFELRPDIVVTDGAHVEYIVDTKWKRLNESAAREGVGSADAYQMHAYATQYGAPEVMLLYPHHTQLGDWTPLRARYLLRELGQAPTNGARAVSVGTIDLTILGTVAQQLESMFELLPVSKTPC